MIVSNGSCFTESRNSSIKSHSSKKSQCLCEFSDGLLDYESSNLSVTNRARQNLGRRVLIYVLLWYSFIVHALFFPFSPPLVVGLGCGLYINLKTKLGRAGFSDQFKKYHMLHKYCI